MGELGGIAIGQRFQGDGMALRVVAIDPELHSVEAEDASGAVLVDTIEHFTATHLPLAG